MLKKVLLILFLSFIAVPAFSQQTAQSMEIAGLTIEGNKTISEEVIKLSSGLTQGKVIYGDDIQNSIKKLWGLNLFSNVIVEGDQVSGGKVFLKIVLEEYPRLAKVKITGVDAFDKDEIEPQIKLYPGQTLKATDIQQVKNDLKEFYKSENYLLAEIEVTQAHINENDVELTVIIDEGAEVEVEKITFHGNKAFDADDLKDELSETKEVRWWRSGDFSKDDYATDLEMLTFFYRNNGYKDYEFLRDSISYNEAGDGMFIDIWLSEGDKYYFGDVSFEGNTIFDDETLTRTLDFDKGDEYAMQTIEMTLFNLSTVFMDKGYLRAQIVPEEQIVGKDTISYKIRISEGSKARVRKINISGNTRTNEKVIRRELAIYPGDVFNKTKIMRSQRNIMMLNYFETAMPEIENQISDKEVDLVVKVKEKPTEQAQTSIAYSESEGFVGSIGLVFNNFSFKRPFMQGDGQKLSTNIEFGKKYYRYSLSVTEPWFMDTHTLVGFSGDYSRRQESYSDTYTTGGSARVGRYFDWSDNYMHGLWIYSVDNIEYENVEDDAPERYELFEGKTVLSSSLTQYLIRDNRDRVEFPTRGSQISLMTKVAGGIFGGDEGFHKHKFEMKWFQPLYKDKIVLYNQFVYGAMDRLGEDSYISSGEYFYLGGGGMTRAEPLRGYDDNSVGPIDAEGGYYIGGRNLFKTTTELRFKFTDDPMLVYGLVFLDAGNLWDSFAQSNLFDLKKGAGFGIRMFVPMIGMMGLDFGYGFDHYDSFGEKRNWQGELRTHFRMGTNL